VLKFEFYLRGGGPGGRGAIQTLYIYNNFFYPRPYIYRYLRILVPNILPPLRYRDKGVAGKCHT
jgi:hypothetical protein